MSSLVVAVTELSFEVQGGKRVGWEGSCSEVVPGLGFELRPQTPTLGTGDTSLVTRLETGLPPSLGTLLGQWLLRGLALLACKTGLWAAPEGRPRGSSTELGSFHLPCCICKAPPPSLRAPETQVNHERRERTWADEWKAPRKPQRQAPSILTSRAHF